MEKYAWITLVATNDFISGAINLNKSLKRVKSKYPLLAIVTNNITKENLDLLKSYGIQYKKFPFMSFLGDSPIEEGKTFEMIEATGCRYWHCTMSKFYVFTFIEYDKVAFVDADILFLENRDIYFTDYKVPAAYIAPYESTPAISGCIFVVKPSYDTFWKMLNIALEYSFEEDESVLNNAYKNFSIYDEKHCLPATDCWVEGDCGDSQKVYHCDGPIKYWMDEEKNIDILKWAGIE